MKVHWLSRAVKCVQLAWSLRAQWCPGGGGRNSVTDYNNSLNSLQFCKCHKIGIFPWFPFYVGTLLTMLEYQLTSWPQMPSWTNHPWFTLPSHWSASTPCGRQVSNPGGGPLSSHLVVRLSRVTGRQVQAAPVPPGACRCQGTGGRDGEGHTAVGERVSWVLGWGIWGLGGIDHLLNVDGARAVELSKVVIVYHKGIERLCKLADNNRKVLLYP